MWYPRAWSKPSMWWQLCSQAGLYVGFAFSMMGHEVGIPVYPTGPRYHVHCLNVVLHICCSHSTIKPGCGSTYMRHYTFSTSLDAAQHGTADWQHNILWALQTYSITELRHYRISTIYISLVYHGTDGLWKYGCWTYVLRRKVHRSPNMAAGIMLRHALAAATMSQTHSTKYNMSWASKTVIIMY